MHKKFYIGICCLALLATSVASGYTEDFEGYTGNVGDQWDGTAEFGTSGWGDLYRGTELWATTPAFDLTAGYNSAQGVVHTVTETGAAKLLPEAQGANGTFVYTAMMNMDGAAARLNFGTDELVASQPTIDGWFSIVHWDYEPHGGTVLFQARINDALHQTGYISQGIVFNDLDWFESKVEVDTNANSRPTVVRIYWRDLEEDGSGPVVETWTQVDLGDTDGRFDLDMTGDDYKIEAIAFFGGGIFEGTGCYFDNLVATVDPAFVDLPGDVDGNGFVDDADLTIILANWGKTGMGSEGGDLNENGIVDGPDYAEVLSYWAPAEPPKTAGVPEPLTLAILGIGSLLVVIGRRRR